MRWASRYTLNHRIPTSVSRAHSSQPSSSRAPLTACLTPKPALLLSSTTSTQTDTMGSSWNPFSTSHSPSRRSSYRPGYASSSYSSSSRHHSSTSRYKRSPRDSYMQHLYKKLQHFLREIWRYAQRHPYKVFFMVIMPLVSGGVLHKLARQFGVHLPDIGGASSSSGARGGHAGSGHSSGYYGSEGYGRDRSGGGGDGMMGGLGNIDMQSVAGGIGGLASLASMASKFM
ncbi:hypothetical protein BDW02DRAFT_626993 [Decorospora gaudefroyi]|uniref:Uncharacterized protein n=1 Tax=Decorospora gaudefroyi TaxID=184978 RepID=A0A6A5KY75_9PLEO|nr:hypothetical protein BDW02DRAFT_626993 [Decorospora gaudefroyi]